MQTHTAAYESDLNCANYWSNCVVALNYLYTLYQLGVVIQPKLSENQETKNVQRENKVLLSSGSGGSRHATKWQSLVFRTFR